ncbi:type II toxin-antitoxin system HicB family antitoxin [Fusibacter ferrireducens]|uniref:Type II toxin-antitoxin system HicB family antitoxin n=1 Tax=Fusibacter ferrireducens TaxID=2785058 RepID=A0ABS0A056_9FIRM|nr:type II toxin-antitoxin system HicB family antitoxin [Fusibacter ferrireducens]MBF4696087.1 type II toxin-antitoxin system HicB family antitoxin [Fusibacter ferrireducens]
MLADRYIFPAIFHFADDGISVEFPDLPGCFSYGDDELQAVTNAKEALELHIFGLEDDSDPIPSPSHIREITVSDNETIVLIDIWMKPVRDYMQNKAIKKTLTIPKWLNDIAVENDVNFSQLLQVAIKNYLGINTRN